jgi:hypothetical protein
VLAVSEGTVSGTKRIAGTGIDLLGRNHPCLRNIGRGLCGPGHALELGVIPEIVLPSSGKPSPSVSSRAASRPRLIGLQFVDAARIRNVVDVIVERFSLPSLRSGKLPYVAMFNPK